MSRKDADYVLEEYDHKELAEALLRISRTVNIAMIGSDLLRSVSLDNIAREVTRLKVRAEQFEEVKRILKDLVK